MATPLPHDAPNPYDLAQEDKDNTNAKSRLLFNKAESVLSDVDYDNASTIAASEAPTSYSLLSGSTFLGQRSEPADQLKESPRLDRFAFVPAPRDISRELAREVERRRGMEEEQATGSKKKGKNKKKAKLPWIDEPADEGDVQQSQQELAATAVVEEEKPAAALQRTTSTLKKGKKKKGSKGVLWTEPVEIPDTRDFASASVEKAVEEPPAKSELPSALVAEVEQYEAPPASEPIAQDEATAEVAEELVAAAPKGKKGNKAKKGKAKVLAWEEEDAFRNEPEVEPSPAEDLPQPPTADAIEQQEAGPISPVQQPGRDVVPQENATAEETSGELAGVHTVETRAESGDGDQAFAEPAAEHPASASRDLVTAPDAARKSDKKGIIASGLSMLGVGSLFGRKKQREPEPTPEAAEKAEADVEEQPTIDVPPSLIPADSQQGSSERVLDVGSLQAAQEPPSHDKSADDTPGSALATAASAPNERVDVPEGSTPGAELTGEPLTAAVTEAEAIRELDVDGSSDRQTKEEKDDIEVAAADGTQEQSLGDDTITSESASAPATDFMDSGIRERRAKASGRASRMSLQKRQPLRLWLPNPLLNLQPLMICGPSLAGRRARKARRTRK